MKLFGNCMLAASAIIGISVAGYAQPPGVIRTRVVLNALDLNHDGILSADELAKAPSSLASLDKDGDGKLSAMELMPPSRAGASPEELAKQLMTFDKSNKGYLVVEDLPERMRGIFQRADANHDGKLTLEEIDSIGSRQAMPAGAAQQGGRAAAIFRMDPLLAALDTNHDGVISAEEIAAARTSLLTLDKNGDGQLTADEIQMHEMSPSERADHIIEEFDSDKDGKVSKAEAPDRLRAEFSKIDKNDDGFLNKSELIEYFEKQSSASQENQDREKKQTSHQQ